MRKTVILIFLLVVSPFLRAQDKAFVVRSFEMDPMELRAKTNPVYDNNGIPAAMVRVSLSVADSVDFRGNIVGTPEHNPGEWIVFMPAGSTWIDIAVDGYAPLHYVFPVDIPLQAARGYVLDLGVKEVSSVRTLVMPAFSYNKSQYSYSLMLGFCKRNGVYIKAKTDFTFGLIPTGVCDENGVEDGIKGWYTGASKKSRLAFTGGYMRQLADPLYLYVGGGWGYRTLAWERFDESYVQVDPYSYNGYEAELGAILRLGAFAISAGVQTNQFKYYEANVGIGVMF